MKKYVPLKKLSKKSQREYYAQQRKTWQGINPATRKLTNKRLYNRAESRKEIQEC